MVNNCNTRTSNAQIYLSRAPSRAYQPPLSSPFPTRIPPTPFSQRTQELAILFRKLGIVVGVILIKSGSGRAVVAFLVILLSCAVHIRFKPYISSRVNRLETIHLVCACVVLAFGMLLASASEASNGVRTFVGVIVIMVVAVNAIAMVCCSTRRLRVFVGFFFFLGGGGVGNVNRFV